MSSQFPFHGIFSALGQNDSEARARSEDAQSGPFSGGQLPEPSFHEPRNRNEPSPTATQRPLSGGQVSVDIYEQDGYYIIKAPIAGVRLSDLDIEITDNIVTIRGARAQHDDVPTDQYYVQECFWGEFSRSITLPFTIDPKKVKATFNKDAVLKILIPKEEKVKIVRINEG